MSSRVRMTLIGVGAGLASALAIGGIAIATDGQSPTAAAPRFDHVSNEGSLVPVDNSVASLLTGAGARAELRRLSVRGPLAFYAAPGAISGICYGVGAVTTGRLAFVGCPRADSQRLDFPSDQAPILDLSGIEGEPATGAVYLLELAGVAADGIAKVGMIDVNGTLHTAHVASNVYYTDLPHVAAAAVVAFDVDGNEVFRHELTHRG